MPKTNTHLKCLWLFTIYMNTNFKLTVYWHDDHQQMPIKAIPLQHYPKLTLKNSVICPFYINKACEDILSILPGFLKDLPQSENLVCGAAIWTKTTLISFQHWFHSFSAFPFKSLLGIHFFWSAKERYFLIIYYLRLLYLYIGRISTHVCHSFGVFQVFKSLVTHLSTIILLRSMSSTFQSDFCLYLKNFNSCMAAVISVNVKIFLSQNQSYRICWLVLPFLGLTYF